MGTVGILTATNFCIKVASIRTNGTNHTRSYFAPPNYKMIWFCFSVYHFGLLILVPYSSISNESWISVRNLWLLFLLGLVLSLSSRHEKVIKWHPFLVQKEVLGEKIIIWVKYGNVFTQIMMFSLKKSWWLESKRTRATANTMQNKCTTTVQKGR